MRSPTMLSRLPTSRSYSLNSRPVSLLPTSTQDVSAERHSIRQLRQTQRRRVKHWKRQSLPVTRALLPRLQQRCQAIATQEQYDRWAGEFDRLLPRYDAAVAQLKTVCEEFEQKIIAALLEAQAVDVEACRLASVKPYDLPQANGDGRHLPKVELAARGLSGVAPGCSLLTDLKLPKFNSTNELAWPPPQPSMAVEVAMHVAAITRHPGADWHKELVARNRAAAEENRERAARQAAEREQRFKEQQDREPAANEQRRLALRRTAGWPV
jgi:hypothetical protein